MTSKSMLPPPETDPSSTPTPTPTSGKLSATILSVYDIPTTTSSSPTGDDASITSFSSTSTTACPVPSYVSMSVMGREVRTGKPSAKHKVMNNFKFVSADKSSPGKQKFETAIIVIILFCSLILLFLYLIIIFFY
jgi:hypothetical protein